LERGDLLPLSFFGAADKLAAAGLTSSVSHQLCWWSLTYGPFPPQAFYRPVI
jgi:hypothetical protein